MDSYATRIVPYSYKFRRVVVRVEYLPPWNRKIFDDSETYYAINFFRTECFREIL